MADPFGDDGCARRAFAIVFNPRSACRGGNVRGWGMRGAKRSRAQLISEDILAECQLESISTELAFLALVRSMGHYLAGVEQHVPNAIELYMKILRRTLGETRP